MIFFKFCNKVHSTIKYISLTTGWTNEWCYILGAREGRCQWVRGWATEETQWGKWDVCITASGLKLTEWIGHRAGRAQEHRVHSNQIRIGHWCPTMTIIYPKSNRTTPTGSKRVLNEWQCMAGRLKGNSKVFKVGSLIIIFRQEMIGS